MKPILFVITGIFLFSASCRNLQDKNANSFALDLSDLRQVGQVDERYQSFNVEMCEVVGGDFWIPYSLLDTARMNIEGMAALRRNIPPIDLSGQKIRTLASALGPAFVRVSGTWANTTFFQDNDDPKLNEAPEGFENVLTRNEWKGVIDFCKAIDAKIITSFAIGDGIRDPDGNWTPVQVAPLLQYTQSIGGEIFGAEMFNEPSHASYGGAPEGYDAAYYARDFATFKSYVDSAAPEMKILGPGSTGEGGILPGSEAMSSDKILTADPNPDFEIFSYHFYGGASQRCSGGLTPENALTEDWLSKTERGFLFYKETRDEYLPGIPIWLTETGEAACGGNPWAATYLDCFRYLEQLGRLARQGVQVVIHNTLAAGEYALLDQDTHDPRPNYWAALLWERLMGTKVYDAVEFTDGVDVFIHSLENSSDGIAVLLVNPGDEEYLIQIPENAEQYLLTADDIQSKTVALNNKTLELSQNDELPDIKGKKVRSGTVWLPSHSILFLTF